MEGAHEVIEAKGMSKKKNAAVDSCGHHEKIQNTIIQYYSCMRGFRENAPMSSRCGERMGATKNDMFLNVFNWQTGFEHLILVLLV